VVAVLAIVTAAFATDPLRITDLVAGVVGAFTAGADEVAGGFAAAGT
jgi:hypothetical protein